MPELLFYMTLFLHRVLFRLCMSVYQKGQWKDILYSGYLVCNSSLIQTKCCIIQIMFSHRMFLIEMNRMQCTHIAKQVTDINTARIVREKYVR